MKIHYKIWAFIAVVILISMVLVHRYSPSQDKTIKIGFIAPLTGFGAVWGIEQKQAIDLAVEEINIAGDTLGKRLEIIYEDGKCDAKTATIAAQKLISIDRVDFLMSSCSAETLATGEIADDAKINLIAAWATNPQISSMSEYVFRNSYSDEDSARILAEDMNKKYASVGVITELGDYSSGMKNAFMQHYTGTVYQEDALPHATDVRTQVHKIMSQKPEALFINANEPGSAIAILQQLSQMRYDGALYGNYIGSIPEIQNMPFAKGMLYPADPELPMNTKMNNVLSKYEARFGQPTFDFAVAVSYDSVYILKQAIEDTKSIDSETIKNYLHALRDFDGVLGIYGFNDQGDAIGYRPSLKQI